jgi:hypothetical protein
VIACSIHWLAPWREEFLRASDRYQSALPPSQTALRFPGLRNVLVAHVLVAHMVAVCRFPATIHTA